MLKKLSFLVLCGSFASMPAQDVPYKINVRLDLLPEIKLVLGNMTLSTMIGAALILLGTGIEQLADMTLPENLVPIIDVPANLIAASGALTFGIALSYNLVKLAQYWRKVGRAELEKLEINRSNCDTLAITL